MLQQTTKRLFYNTWPIKVECYIRGASKVRYMGPEQTIDWCDGKFKPLFGSDQDKKIDKLDLKKFTKKFVSCLSNQEYRIRTEGSHLNIFCKDKSLLDKIQKEMFPWIQRVTAPENDDQHNFLMESGPKKILCDRYPHEIYRYRVYFRESTNIETRQKFLNWVEKLTDKTKIARNTREWFTGNKKYIQDPFMYIDDEKTLSMVLLYIGTQVKKTQEFILKTNINS